ncbi:hypothetical protein HPB51_003359 [Rhipicephalus microplus]|uniref:Uncharacterized protein n=1 Tax=Rhipicephalus microplus TaxID=6941 RepID=A0A9J6D3T0_RHIMP|nr:hypothetical protein HPB51_003359 [Rhipicephalus microplus]
MVKTKNLLITPLGTTYLDDVYTMDVSSEYTLSIPNYTHALTARRLDTAPMCALNLGTGAARVAEKTTTHHRKERHQHAKHAISSVKEDTSLTAQDASTTSPKSLNHFMLHKHKRRYKPSHQQRSQPQMTIAHLPWTSVTTPNSEHHKRRQNKTADRSHDLIRVKQPPTQGLIQEPDDQVTFGMPIYQKH